MPDIENLGEFQNKINLSTFAKLINVKEMADQKHEKTGGSGGSNRTIMPMENKFSQNSHKEKKTNCHICMSDC